MEKVLEFLDIEETGVWFSLEPGVGVEPTSAIHAWMLTTGCYEMFLQPVA
jgi:hypothetical protein